MDKYAKVNFILKAILVLNVFVLLVKLYIGLSSKSLSILGDAVHSGVDSLNNVIGICMVTFASKPPDKEHPYGHQKFETLGALGVVAFLAIASFELIEKSIMRFFQPADLPIIETQTIVLLCVTLIINIAVWWFEKKAGEKYDSEFLIADAEHTFSDVLITSAILASTFFILKGFYILDPILGIIVAIVILRSGWEILSRSVPILVDEAWVDPHEIESLVMSIDKAASCENIRSRKGHIESFIEMTVKFSTDSLSEAHALSHEVENKILEKFGDAQVTIHIEPED